jgi:nicotinamidase-related amidase
MSELDPSRTALLVMDYQRGILGRMEDADALAAKARAAIDTMREAGATIGYVRVAFTEEDLEAIPDGAPMARVKAMPAGSMGADAPTTQIDDRVAPAAGDIVVRKVRVGAFGTTDLDEQLRARGVDALVLAGISTSGVTISTLVEAHDRVPDRRLLPQAGRGDRGRRPGRAARLGATRASLPGERSRARRAPAKIGR